MRAEQRGISFQEIIDTIKNPDTIQKQDENVFCFKKKWKEQLLLVYARDETWNWIIITVIKTSKITKYE